MAAALALARIGDAPRATARVGELEKGYPANPMLKLYWPPTINAAIELNEGNSSQTLVHREAAAPYELGSGVGFINYLYPAYVSVFVPGIREWPSLLAEFQKRLDHRGCVLNFVTGALVHLQIGRASAMAGESAKAKSAYNDFLTLWKMPTPTSPSSRKPKRSTRSFSERTQAAGVEVLLDALKPGGSIALMSLSPILK